MGEKRKYGKKVVSSLPFTKKRADASYLAAKSGGIGLAELLYKQLAPQVLAETAAPPEAASPTKP